jgi:hypothetical protein
MKHVVLPVALVRIIVSTLVNAPILIPREESLTSFVVSTAFHLN